MTYIALYETPETCFKGVVKIAFYRETQQTQETLECWKTGSKTERQLFTLFIKRSNNKTQ